MPATVRPRFARSLATRNALLMIALLPGMAVQVAHGDRQLPVRLAIALAAALLSETMALRARAQPLRPYLAEGSAFAFAAIMVAWLPALDGWRLVAAVFVAISSRQAFGGLGTNPFHPVAVGVACAQLLLSVPAATAAPDAVLAGAWLCGGAVLLAMGVARWQAPAGLFAAAALALVCSGHPLSLVADPRCSLVACFVLTDPVTAGEQGRSRFLAGAGVGLLAALAAGLPFAALPFAVLAMNALTRGLDSMLARPRRRTAQ